MRSSYKENNYGDVLLSLIIGKKPEMCVEVGVLDGYSTLHIARGLKFNKEVSGVEGKLWSWDLWDEYEYKHGNEDEVQKLIDDEGLTDFVNLSSGDAFDVSHIIASRTVDFLHVDISNNGNILKKVMNFWSHRLRECGIIAFEGGSEERDNIEWMVKYHKPKIREELKNNKIIKEDFGYYIMSAFPSMTIFQKKGCLNEIYR